MTRPAALLGSAVFFVLAPGILAGLVPWLITGWDGPFAHPAAAAAGLVLIAAGVLLIVECFARFALVGMGTPAPVAPPTRLVVSGAYRRVRNPMYVAVVSMAAGQAALFADFGLFLYAAVLWLGFHLFVIAYEEPTLREKFPEDYAAFFAAVPRWRPRLRPWRG
jgi:protein-S-isoprenylcysteine O-methyltransferase Ste14